MYASVFSTTWPLRKEKTVYGNPAALFHHKEEFGSYNTLLKIMIPKGTKGLYIDLISNRGEEQELLCARGSKLKVLFTYRRRKKNIIICKMLKSEEADKSEEI